MDENNKAINIKPKICDDIYYNNDLYVKYKHEFCVIGSIKNDCNMLVNSSKAEAVRYFLNLLDGTKTVEEIKNCLCEKGIDVDAEALIYKLQRTGFLEGEDVYKGNNSFSEVDKMSLHIAKVRISSLFSTIRPFAKYIIYLFFFIVSILFIFLTINIFNGKIDIKNLLTYKNSYIKGFIFTELFLIIALMLHELAHGITAAKNGLKPSYVSFVLYCYFIPMYYVKIPGMYSLKKKKLLEVVLAGVIANAGIAVLCLTAYCYCNIELLKIISLSNIKIIIMNLMPWSLTDGYFVFTTILEQPNLRKKYYRILISATDARLRKTINVSKIELLYVALSIFMLISNLSINLYWIIQGMKHNLGLNFIKSINNYLLLIIFVVLYILFYIFIINIRFKKSYAADYSSLQK